MEVQQRDADTLLLLIAQYICPGSIVYSDEWSTYNQLSATTGLAHQTVNHSLHFVDPISGAHTQGVEAMWSSCKRMLRGTNYAFEAFCYISPRIYVEKVLAYIEAHCLAVSIVMARTVR